jgi:hypothetical protein
MVPGTFPVVLFVFPMTPGTFPAVPGVHLAITCVYPVLPGVYSAVTCVYPMLPGVYPTVLFICGRMTRSCPTHAGKSQKFAGVRVSSKNKPTRPTANEVFLFSVHHSFILYFQ